MRTKNEGCQVLNSSNFTAESFHIYGELIIQRDKNETGEGNQSEIELSV